MASLVFVVLEMLFLAGAHWLGGPPWVVLGAATVVFQSVMKPHTRGLLYQIPAAIWLICFYLVHNRELFFPYSIALAACVTRLFEGRSRWPGFLAGACIVTLFMLVRILQQATPRVLAVELAVAVIILIALQAFHGRRWRNQLMSLLIVGLASILAYIGLAF